MGDRRLLWFIVGIVAIERVLADLPVFLPSGSDAYEVIGVARQALSNPGAIYPESAAQIAAGFPYFANSSPPGILIAIPFIFLAPPFDVWSWVVANALMSLAGLVMIYRAVAPRNRWSLPISVLVVLCFTPLFEDIRVGQRGGPLMLLTGAAMLTVRRHPAWAGLLTGIATSIKFYPAALALSVGPRQWWRFTGAMLATAAVVLLVTFIPFGSPVLYLTKVLIPVSIGGSAAATHDCFQNSTPLLFSRLVDGTSFSVIDKAGVWKDVTLVPWHLPWLAQLLTYLTIASLVVGTVWAAWRSGWAQPYSMSLAFSLGALVPGHVYTYQFIPILPLTMVLVLRAIETQRWGVVALVGIAELVLINSPCALVFPGLWTVAGLAIFAAAVTSAKRFRDPANLVRTKSGNGHLDRD
ncbi:MAG TPA: glycosyltransferase family 87 protein [Candidatus Dormibacteraeota bacterium]